MRIKTKSRHHQDTMQKVEYLLEHMQPAQGCEQVGKQYILKMAINLLYDSVKSEQERGGSYTKDRV